MTRSTPLGDPAKPHQCAKCGKMLERGVGEPYLHVCAPDAPTEPVDPPAKEGPPDQESPGP